MASNKIIRSFALNLSTIWLGSRRPPTHVRGGPHESFVIFFGLLDPAAAVEQLFYELHSAHIVKVRVRAEVAGCVLVAVIFPGIEIAGVPLPSAQEKCFAMFQPFFPMGGGGEPPSAASHFSEILIQGLPARRAPRATE